MNTNKCAKERLLTTLKKCQGSDPLFVYETAADALVDFINDADVDCEYEKIIRELNKY